MQEFVRGIPYENFFAVNSICYMVFPLCPHWGVSRERIHLTCWGLGNRLVPAFHLKMANKWEARWSCPYISRMKSGHCGENGLHVRSLMRQRCTSFPKVQTSLLRKLKLFWSDQEVQPRVLQWPRQRARKVPAPEADCREEAALAFWASQDLSTTFLSHQISVGSALRLFGPFSSQTSSFWCPRTYGAL